MRHFLRAALVAAPLAFAYSSPAPAPTKLDPAVQAAVDSGQTVAVVILGHTQLFERLHGLDDFERTNANAQRLTLRRDVVAKLKSIATREQASILRALGKKSAEQSLWIANAMVLTLTAAEIRRAAELREVEFVYPSFEQFAKPESIGALEIVLPRGTRPTFSSEGKRVPWNLERLNVPRVWSELDNRGEGATVAILDGGADYAHADLRTNIWKNPGEIPGNGIDDDRNGYVDDYYGYDFANMRAEVRDTASRIQHGTWTSGIVGGDGTGGIITGVAPRATLMLLIARGPVTNGLAYQYALENRADVISMSFSIPNLGNVRGLWRMMSEHAVAAGVVLVGGAGNFQTSSPIPVQVQTPKDIPSVIAVGGVDSTLQLVPFSSMGPVEWGSVALYGDSPMPNGLVKPDVVAFPGADYPVLATNGSGYIDPNTKIRGNSFSGPHGAGVAALMLSADPSLPAWRVKEILERTAHDLEAPGKDMRTGAGLIDAFAAVREVRNARRPATAAPSSGTQQGGVDAATARQRIQETYGAWSKARLSFDRAASERMLAPEFYAQIPGQRMDRATFIDQITAPIPNVRFARYDAKVLTIERHGGDWVVVITEKLEYERTGPGGETQRAYSMWVTRDGWHQDGDQWRATFSETISNESWGWGKKPPFSDW